jgi:hypothetical protein
LIAKPATTRKAMLLQINSCLIKFRQFNHIKITDYYERDRGPKQLPYHHQTWPRNEHWLAGEDLQATEDFASMSRRCILE